CWPRDRFFLRPSGCEGGCAVPTLAGIQPEPAAVETADQRAKIDELTRKAADSDQERQRLAAKVQELETALAEKDQALKQLGQEVQLSADEIARARAEMQHCNQELSALRARLHDAERENVTTLQSLISTVEQLVGPETPARQPESPEPKQPPH